MIDRSARNRIADNWQSLCADVQEAAVRSGRQVDEITIVGVSKYVDADTTRALFDAGCHHLGESRPQSLWEKADRFGAGHGVHWHLIGHLQRNKIRRTLRLGPLIHSVDSQRLLQALADEALRQQCVASVLLEVNVSGDESKTGFALPALLRAVEQLPLAGVHVRGLMAMAGWGANPADAREQFDRVRELRDRLQGETGQQLSELSMGMSGDFAEAIAAGATMVRVGSRLFEGVA